MSPSEQGQGDEKGATVAGTRDRDASSRKINEDADRLKLIDACFNSPSDSCDTQMAEMAKLCAKDPELKNSLSCQSDKIATYLSVRGLDTEKTQSKNILELLNGQNRLSA